MISSVTNQGKVRWMIYRDNLNSEVFIKFLDRLAKDADKKVFLIVDNLRVHHSAPVKEWLVENAHRIELFFLPSYSPERNPDEYLNGDLKGSLGRMPPPANRDQLEANLKLHMRKLRRHPRATSPPISTINLSPTLKLLSCYRLYFRSNSASLASSTLQGHRIPKIWRNLPLTNREFDNSQHPSFLSKTLGAKK